MGNMIKKSMPPSVQDWPAENWSPLLHEMYDKYGLESLQCIYDWEKMGFPKHGTLNIKTLRELKEKLNMAEQKMRKRKKIKMLSFNKCTLHKKVFSMWMAEAEERDRKANIEVLPNVHSLTETRAQPGHDKIQNTALYPSGRDGDQRMSTCGRPTPAPSAPPMMPTVTKKLGDSQRRLQGRGMNNESTQVPAAVKQLGGENIASGVVQHPGCQADIPKLANDNGANTATLTHCMSDTRNATQPQVLSTPPPPCLLTPENIQATPLLPYAQGKRRHGPVTFAQGMPRHLDSMPTAKELYSESRIQPEQANDHTERQSPHLQCPMMEAPDAYGQIVMVQRFWSPTDISQYAATLKRPSQIGGQRWTDQLRAFSRTYRPTMREILDICAKNMDASKMQKILDAAETYHDERPILVRYEDNGRYMTAIEAVCEKIMTLFPTVLNLTEMQHCKQGKDESVSQFHHRLRQTLLTHGGGYNPNNPFEKAFLAQQLMENMHGNISQGVKQTLIGYKTADPEEIIKHAIHAEELYKDDQENYERQEEEKATSLQMAMMEIVTKLSDRADNAQRLRNESGDQEYDHIQGANENYYEECDEAYHRERDCDYMQGANVNYYDECDEVCQHRGSDRDHIQRADDNYYEGRNNWT